MDSPFGTFSFSPVTGVMIRVTDAFVVGDQFRLSWTGTTSGFFDTSVPLDDGSTNDDPDAAFASADFSSGSAFFGPGNYDFTLETIALATGFESGGGYIRADVADSTVPEPATMTLLATGLAGMAATRRRKKH